MERHHRHWLAFELNYSFSLLKTNCHLIHLHYVQPVYLQNMSAHRQDKLKLQNIKGQKIPGWLLSDKIFIPPPPPHHHINKPTQ